MVHAVGRLRPDAQPAAGLRLHGLDRARLDQHGHRRGAGHHQPDPGAAAARRRLRHPGRRPGAAGAGGPARATTSRVNDAFRPVSRFFDRVCRPEQLPAALLGAMRVLTDPAETGAVTLALPQDVQAEAYDWPDELFAERVWHVARPVPEPAALDRAAALIRAARAAADRRRRRRHLLRGRPTRCGAFAEATGIPVADTQAGKGALPWDHPCAVGGVGATGIAGGQRAGRARPTSSSASAPGTATSPPPSRTVFADPDVRFVNLNVAAFDAAKHAGVARWSPTPGRASRRSTDALAGWRVDEAYRDRDPAARRAWQRGGRRAPTTSGTGRCPRRPRSSARSTTPSATRDVVVSAAGSMPGDLQMLWRARDPKQYHVEYGYSCMGYEIAGGARRRRWPTRTARSFVAGRRRLVPDDGARRS